MAQSRRVRSFSTLKSNLLADVCGAPSFLDQRRKEHLNRLEVDFSVWGTVPVPGSGSAGFGAGGSSAPQSWRLVAGRVGARCTAILSDWGKKLLN